MSKRESMKFLVLTDKYYPKPYANAVCAQDLIDEMNFQGHSVDILAYRDYGVDCPEQWNGNTIYYVEPDLRRKLFYFADNTKSKFKAKITRIFAILMNRAKKFFLLPWHPLYSLSLIHRTFRKLIAITNETDYDAIISIMCPFEHAVAACRLKQRYPEKKVIVYAVDTLRNARMKNDKLFANGFFWEKRILSGCDYYFYMKARKDEFSSERYNRYREKLIEVDLPRLVFKDCSEIKQYDFGTIGENWVYAGSLGGMHYDPQKMIDVMEAFLKTKQINLHMYVRGTTAERIKEYAHSNNLSIYVHDYVDQATLQQIMSSADVLVTLKTSNHISAKIFECISYVKPVVHFSGVNDDPNVPYYEGCSLFHIVRTYADNIAPEISKLKNWAETYKAIEVSVDELKQRYIESTPEFSVNKIIDCSRVINNR